MAQLKQYWKNGPRWARVLFWVFLAVGVGLIIGSFFVPPLGVIDASVLRAVGEIQGFASFGVAFECIFTGMSISLQKGDITIDVTSQNK